MKHLIFFLFFVCVPITACAGNSFLPNGNYALNMGNQRMSAPYPPIANFNTDLTQQGVGPLYTVPVSRHHIIPFNILRSFYNAVLNNGHMIYLRGFLYVMQNNMNGYAGVSGMDCSSNAGSIERAMNIAAAFSYNLIHPGGDVTPDGLDDFQEFYTWLPGNLFIGPTNRSDDPGDGFEEASFQIIGADAYALMREGYDSMQLYVNSNDVAALRSAVVYLSKIAQRKNAYQLNSSDWVKDKDGHYHIRTDEIRNPSAKNIIRTHDCEVQSHKIILFNSVVLNSIKK